MKPKKLKALSKPTGRPRSFNCDKALDRALGVFWRKGYEGASLADLTTAMDINRPSLYAAFGDKEALFRKVLDRYAEGPGSHALKALAEPTSRDVVVKLLRGSADLLTAARGPRGCLLVQGALTCGSAADSLRKELISRRMAGESALRQRFQRAKAEGDLPADANPANLARYVTTIIHGMSVQAAGGATLQHLRHVADIVLQNWPTSSVLHKKQLGTPAITGD